MPAIGPVKSIGTDGTNASAGAVWVVPVAAVVPVCPPGTYRPCRGTTTAVPIAPTSTSTSQIADVGYLIWHPPPSEH